MTEDGSHTVRLKNSEITFHSGRGAIQESQHVFISAGFQYYIQHKTKKEISVFEVGFGTGLNVLLTAIVASRSDKQVVYYAVDEYPLPMEIYANLNYASILNEEELYKIIMQTGWNQLLLMNGFLKLDKTKISLADYNFDRNFDIIYFDAFAPDDQAAMWTEAIFKKLYDALNDDGVLVTYCSKSIVRKRLHAVGFTVEKLKGPPGKREIIRALKR